MGEKALVVFLTLVMYGAGVLLCAGRADFHGNIWLMGLCVPGFFLVTIISGGILMRLSGFK